MKYLSILSALFLCLNSWAQNTVKYTGTIGEKYNIQMELSSSNDKDFTGRYRYEGKKDWIELKGSIYKGKSNISQHLVLQEFVGDTQNGTFELDMESGTLNGTWRRELGSPLMNVKLTKAVEKLSPLDGFYYMETNEMKIHVSSESEMDVTIWIPSNKNCKGIKLSGKLIKYNDEWVGSLEDENGNGSAAVLLTFLGENVNIQINPAFLPGTGCQMGKNPYVRQMRKEAGELK